MSISVGGIRQHETENTWTQPQLRLGATTLLQDGLGIPLGILLNSLSTHLLAAVDGSMPVFRCFAQEVATNKLTYTPLGLKPVGPMLLQ